jgi:hypothetical protein
MNFDSLFNTLIDEFQKKQKIEFDKLVVDKSLEEMNDKIMTMIGKDLFNYDDLPVIRFDENKIVERFNSIIHDRSHHLYQERIKFVNYTKNFVIGEKIIIKINKQYPDMGGQWNQYPTNEIHNIYLTNYGSLACIHFDNNNNLKQCEVINYKFWIPKDYIIIIQAFSFSKQLDIYNREYRDVNMTIEEFKSLIEHLRDNLLNGHYVKNKLDIHYMDVYQEKHKLEQDIIEFNKSKETFMFEKMKLDEDRQKLQDDRQKLKLIAQKIKLERSKLEKEQISLQLERDELQKLKLSDIDIYDLLLE